jgi:glycerophosphoryl diester phosphodiesterase
MIFSFKREIVETLARLEPQLPTTWLIGNMPWREAERREKIVQALSARVSAIGLPVERVNPAILRMAHESGFPVFVWTVNDPADMLHLKRIGVDGIITDRPDVLLQILEAAG